jgi:hypothetical protein
MKLPACRWVTAAVAVAVAVGNAAVSTRVIGVIRYNFVPANRTRFSSVVGDYPQLRMIRLRLSTLFGLDEACFPGPVPV